MMPDETLSTEPILGQLIVVDKEPSLMTSREWGGVNLSDPSQGLQVKIWSCATDGTNIIVSAEDSPSTIVVTGSDITSVSLAFDQNMQPFVAFVEGGQAKYYWYDSLIEDFAITDLPVGSTTPVATLDDHRDSQLATSDIIMVYIRDGNMYFRAQRDRYLIEYLLYPDINLDIVSPQVRYVAMNTKNRLQIQVAGVFGGS